MYLLGVSGGPDSMFLLNEYKNRKIIVAHVNYNLRSSSKTDEKILKNYCKKNNIKIEILQVNEKPKGNTESWARKIRYDFFKKIYLKYNCKKLLIAHHKDDFLETALMQQRSGRTPFYFGIKKKIFINDMNILRPYINLYWKNQILEEIKKHKIPYGIDETNNDEKFSRNKIRKELSSWTQRKKNSYISWFKMSNKILRKKEKKVNNWYLVWEKSNFSIKTFINIPNFKQEIIFKYIHEKFENINLSKNKINAIINFIEGAKGKKNFKLNEKESITKFKGFLKNKILW